MPSPHSALLVVDVQRDFCPGGSLSVPDGSAIVQPLNALLSRVRFPCGVHFSKDWHPSNHISFASLHPPHNPFDVITLPDGVTQTLWPAHCVQNTAGAEFAPGLDVSIADSVVLKGMDKRYDSYSAFFDNHRAAQTELADVLQEGGTQNLYVCGLALDVCVLFSVLDAVELGFQVVLLEDLCRGLSPHSHTEAIVKMRDAGVQVCTSDQIE